MAQFSVKIMRPTGSVLSEKQHGAVQQAVVRAMTSNTSLATLLLKEDRQGIGMLTSMIYDMIKNGEMLDPDDFRMG